MSRAFDYCAKFVLAEEGGEVNDRLDPGGHTNLGVTQTALDRARRHLPDMPASVSQLTRGQAMAIYESLYWAPIHGDELPIGLALIVFDACVNQGERDAIHFLQSAVGASVDGHIGPKTIEAAILANPKKAICEVGARRMVDYMALSETLQGRFGLGWSRRLMRIVAAALEAKL